MPFLVTTCDNDGVVRFWEWDVDPLTRKPQIPDGDIEDIIELIDAADLIYLHNSKFDARALATIGVQLPWPKVRDTLIASHLLASNHPHNLTWCCQEYLGVDIEPFELKVKEVTQACRAIVKRDYPNWNIADEGKPGMPSVKASTKRDEDKPWKNDMWLPRALAKQHHGERDNYPDEWLTACSEYANADSEHTLPLGLEMERLILKSGYWKVYEHRLHMPRVDCEMESYGITARGDYTTNTIRGYEEHVAESEAELKSIAAGFGHRLELADGAGLNDNMRDFFYGSVQHRCPRCNFIKRVKHWNGEVPTESICPKCSNSRKTPVRVTMQIYSRSNLQLPVIKAKDSGNATLNGDAMKEYLQTLDDGPALDFITLLSDKRAYDTALTYMNSYRRYWIPVEGHPGYYRIHCSINPCGTDHLRQASNSPNMQNVSGESKEISNRGVFGPLPDREWYKMDYKSIEARIPAYESGEPSLVEVFDKPDEPPYWGNIYNLVAYILYPEEYGRNIVSRVNNHENEFKKEYPKLYKRAKFFVLARQYGAGKRKGDLLAGFSGASDMVESGLPLLAALQAKYLRGAESMGYVETLPDRSVDPERGYPILASRTNDGRVLSTSPFNYHISGTACWAKNTALIRCSDQCTKWREEGFDAHVVLEVHDELLFDFPRGNSIDTNKDKAMLLKHLMEQSGEDLIPRVPTPVSVDYCKESWAEGITIC
jgi:DNA polymerase I-like protein with 3'-5' exonuclease and polymerase domains